VKNKTENKLVTHHCQRLHDENESLQKIIEGTPRNESKDQFFFNCGTDASVGKTKYEGKWMSREIKF
jgi:hypothetical protein